MYLQDVEFLWAMVSLGELYTDDNTDVNDANANTDNANNDNTNYDDNDTWWTNYDCIGLLACMPNEPKTATSAVFGRKPWVLRNFGRKPRFLRFLQSWVLGLWSSKVFQTKDQ